MDELLKLDPERLDQIAFLIRRYCDAQKEVMNDFFEDMSYLSTEWVDDQTMGQVLAEAKILENEILKIMDEIISYYPQFFEDKAYEIRNRPKL